MQENKKTGGSTVKRQLKSVTLYNGTLSRHIMKLMNMQPLGPSCVKTSTLRAAFIMLATEVGFCWYSHHGSVV